MPCTNPNAIRFVNLNGEIRSVFLGPAVHALSADSVGDASDLPTIGKFTSIVPCGKCPSCRADYARIWANRCLMELQYNPKAIFVTLTYRDFDLPLCDDGPTLRIRDTQLFLKRLRKFFSPKPIRFLLSGEYGSTTQRPHYHAILFGLSLNDFPDFRVVKYNKLGTPLFTSPTLERIWSHGIVSIGSVTKQSCDYVCRYVLKKQSDLDSGESFDVRQPPFITSSRRPGIGLQQIEQYVDKLSEHVTVDGKDGKIYDFALPPAVKKSLRYHNIGLDKLDELWYTQSVGTKERFETLLATYNLPYSEILRRLSNKKLDSLKLLPERTIE